ncbi:MAG: ATP-binding protein [Ktedonobacteraceae bacterium]|nr:ATP-binding protein [Ktedonobacteraceae bacterium]MBO0790017.1 ATP-binding protein [Ktedonobacteraceae bacterium]
MKRAGGTFTHVPNWARRFLSQNPAEKTWTCDTCGEIEPFHFAQGWYARRRCACEERAEEQRQRQQVPRTLAEAIKDAQMAQTYTWLGAGWTASELEARTFSTFEQERQPEAFAEVRAFAIHPQGNLWLYGSYGVGKTHLLAALANLRRSAGRPCLFASAVTLFDAIQERIGNDQDYHLLLKQAVQTPLLLLDDIDKPKVSAFRQEIYYQLIDGRTRRGLPLAISSNCPPAELDDYIGGAARSRLMMGIIPIHLNGIDYRLERR